MSYFQLAITQLPDHLQRPSKNLWTPFDKLYNFASLTDDVRFHLISIINDKASLINELSLNRYNTASRPSRKVCDSSNQSSRLIENVFYPYVTLLDPNSRFYHNIGFFIKNYGELGSKLPIKRVIGLQSGGDT